MKKIINKALLKSIINSDFFLIKNKINNNNNIYLDKKSNITKTKSLSSLDVFELLKSLKQFIRILQFLVKNRGYLHISVENKQHSFLLKQFILENNFKIDIKINNLSSLKSQDGFVTKSKVFLVLGSDSFMTKENVFNKLNIEKFFLFSKINTNIETNNLGVYKIYNDLFDFKKIIFIIVLINEVLKKNI